MSDPSTPNPLKIVLARLRFVSVFVVAALAVGYWDTIKNYYDKWTRPAVSADALAGATDTEYFCPMHPNVVSDKPGNCSVCGMPLAKRKKGEKTVLPANVLERVQLTPSRIALAGLRTSRVQKRELTREIRAVGVLDYNETKLARLSARVAGRADELFVQFTGQEVRKDDPLYSLYSPEVYTTQREYLLARKRVTELLKDAPPDARADAAAVYNASMQKLVLWGISRKQLDTMDAEYDASGNVPTHLTVTSPIAGIVVRKDLQQGQYVQVGQDPYIVADLDTLWLQAKLFEQDIPLVQVGQAADVTVEAFPNEVFHGTVTFKAFQLDSQTRTLDARVELPNPGKRLRPGMFAEAIVRVPVIEAKPASTRPAATSAPAAMAAARVYSAALEPYLEAQKLLAADKSEHVAEILETTAATLRPLADDQPALAAEVEKIAAATRGAKGRPLDDLRALFGEISSAMIALGQAVSLPPGAPEVQVFRCPMAKRNPNWIQPPGQTANPYYGSRMLTCGTAIAPLPRLPDSAAPGARPVGAALGVLAVPRTAVIDTGHRKIVYVQSADGTYDMLAVKVGAPAGDYYPVTEGLNDGDEVVTVGTFLVDAENRLNPNQK